MSMGTCCAQAAFRPLRTDYRKTISASCGTIVMVMAARLARTCAGPIRATVSRKMRPRRRRCSTRRITIESSGAAASSAARRRPIPGRPAGAGTALHVPEFRYRPAVRICAADLDSEPELRDAVRRNRSARRTEGSIHGARTAFAEDCRGRDLRPVGGGRIFFSAEHPGTRLSGAIVSATAGRDVLRPPANGFKAWLTACLMAYVPLGFRVLRTIRPILRFGNTIVVTRYDDVREVFLNDAAFRVPYKDKLDIIMGGHPFFLSMDDTPEYRRDKAAMRLVVRPADITERLAGEVERRGGHIHVPAPGHPVNVHSPLRPGAVHVRTGCLLVFHRLR